MIKILIITHGQLGAEILRTAELIVGKQEEVSFLTLAAHEGLQAMCQRTGEAIRDVENSNGILILTDMLGGTPCNASLPYCNTEKIEIVSGINLYMLLSAFLNRKSLPLKELSNKIIEDGKKSIANAKEIFLKKLK